MAANLPNYLLFLIDSTSLQPEEDLNSLRDEIDNFDQKMLDKPWGIVYTKADLLGQQKFINPLPHHPAPYYLISAVSGTGVESLIVAIGQAVSEFRTRETHKLDTN